MDATSHHNTSQDKTLSGLSILFAEDDPLAALLVCEELQDRGARVVHAGDGQRALDFFHQDEYDLVISDIHMPHINGIELLIALRSESGVPFIGLSGNAHDLDGRTLIEAGALAVLPKPFDRKRLEMILIEHGLLVGAGLSNQS